MGKARKTELCRRPVVDISAALYYTIKNKRKKSGPVLPGPEYEMESVSNASFRGKNALVMGLARSGFAAARLLHTLGAKVTVTETKPVSELPEAASLAELGIPVCPQDEETLSRDWDLVIKNPGINGNLPVIKALRARCIPVITEIELAFLAAAPQRYIGITGTNGKTTTCSMCYEILERVFPGKTHLCGNIGVALCETVLQNGLLHEAGHVIVLEISNFQLLDIERFHPGIGVILNLAPDHLDFMGSEDAYYRSKCRVYENMTEDEIFLQNADDPVLAEYMRKLPCRAKRVTFSLKDPAADLYADEQTLYAFGKPVLPLSALKIVGRHNVQNTLAAVGAALAAGASPAEAAAGAAAFAGVEHRIEYVRTAEGVRYYNDSKGTNVDATVTAVNAFDAPVILLAGGYEKGLSFEPLKPLLPKMKAVIGYGACGARLIDELTGGAGTLCRDLPEALAAARALATEGDVVLLSPTTSSFDQYSCFEERGEHFKQLVNAL